VLPEKRILAKSIDYKILSSQLEILLQSACPVDCHEHNVLQILITLLKLSQRTVSVIPLHISP